VVSSEVWEEYLGIAYLEGKAFEKGRGRECCAWQ